MIITWLTLWREEITGMAAKIDPSQPACRSGLVFDN